MLGKFGVSLLNDIGIAALVALGLVLLTGVGGATSFGQAAFVGIAAYATRLAHHRAGRCRRGSASCSRWRSPALAALAIGVLTLRLGGHFLPLSHHRLGAVDRAAVRQRRCARPPHRASSNIPPLRLGGWSLADPRAIYYLIWVLVGARLRCSATTCCSRGRAARSAACAAAAMLLASVGADAFRVRLTLFVLAALLAGLAGWLYAHMNRFVSPSPFDVRASIEYLLMAVAGGLGQLAARWSARRWCWC